jgi:DNA invertase Pin-like site-specific DNA recombinase
MAGRSGLQQLVNAAKSKQCGFDCLLVYDMSRLARDLSDCLKTFKTLDFYCISVVSVSQGIDSAQGNARPMLAMHGMMDEEYLADLARKVHRGQEGRVIQGLHPGGRCYGYRNVPIEDPTRTLKYGRPAVLGVRLEIIPEEAAVVRRIFQLYADGTGLAGIASLLNAEGVPSPKPARNRRLQAWSRYTVREMLHNERYRGFRCEVWDTGLVA